MTEMFPSQDGPPAAPIPVQIPIDEPLGRLLHNLRNALRALPVYFSSGTHIEGLEAGDLFSLNSVLGGTIEIQVVETLNRIRQVWDPDGEWDGYHFARMAQSFPDVRLVSRSAPSDHTVLGLELKGWYLLAKEGVPSFRYTVNPGACAPQDLLVVVPWHLKNVLSGVPLVYEPYIEQARYVAEFRNYWWQHLRSTSDSTEIRSPDGLTPYPAPKSKVNDAPVTDRGKNFGRVARLGIMNDYVEQLLATRVSGVEAQHWVSFFKLYSEAADPEVITKKLAQQLKREASGISTQAAERLHGIIVELRDALTPD